jgi:hypothetical protein
MSQIQVKEFFLRKTERNDKKGSEKEISGFCRMGIHRGKRERDKMPGVVKRVRCKKERGEGRKGEKGRIWCGGDIGG